MTKKLYLKTFGCRMNERDSEACQLIIYEEVLREFQRRKVRYLIVGGIAQNLNGSMRATADLDILVEMSDSNLEKIVRILKKQGYRVRQPVDPMGIADQTTRMRWIRDRHMNAFNFYKNGELKEVDIIIGSPITYEKAKEKAVSVRVGSLVLPFISIDHLIKMKSNTGRDVELIPKPLSTANGCKVRGLRPRAKTSSAYCREYASGPFGPRFSTADFFRHKDWRTRRCFLAGAVRADEMGFGMSSRQTGRSRAEKDQEAAKEKKMKFRWESETERLLRFMKIPPKAKLEWLRQMNDFAARRLPRRTRRIRLKLRRDR